MAKKTKDRIVISQLPQLENLKAINEKYHENPNVEEEKQMGVKEKIQFKIHKDWNYRTKLLHIAFLQKNEYISPSGFFHKMVYLLSTHLKSTGKYQTAPDTFIQMITRKGRRLPNQRSFSVKDKIILGIFIEDDAFKKELLDVMYSLSQLDPNKEENYHSYSMSYFYLDILQHAENHMV